MKKFTLFKWILIVVFILPIFYEHFNFLPEAIKYLLDILVLLYFLNFQRFTRYRTNFTSLYVKYIVVIVVITFISLIVHHEIFLIFFQELRRLVYPLVFYLMIKDILDSYEDGSIRLHKLFLTIFFIQVPVTILQSLLFPILKRFPIYTSGGSINMIDIASGTLGSGATSTLGILIPLIIIYFYDLKIFKYSLWFIVPIIIINSGGGLILFTGILTVLAVYSFTHGSLKFRVRALGGLVILIGLFLVFSTTAYFQENISGYENSFVRYDKLFVRGGQQTFGGDENYKIDRLNGYKYLRSKMDATESWIGLGFTFKENGYKPDYQFKSDINSIIAERGFFGLFVYFVFGVFFMIYEYRMLRARGYRQIFIKLLVFAAFFLGGFYNPTTRSFQLWLFVVYFLALLENKDQYLALTNKNYGYKYNRRGQE